MSRSDTLLIRWLSLFPHTTGAAAGEAFAFVCSRYEESGRHYHTLAHIEACLRLFDEMRELFQQPSTAQVVLIFHDTIYDPRRQDNEVRSADYCLAICQPIGGGSLAEWAYPMIMATRHSVITESSNDIDLVLDIDLSILGEEPGVYLDYASAIRKEYGFVPGAEYAAGRIRVLQSFLDRKRIFRTAPFSGAFEQRARQNIQGEIDFLTKALP